MIRLPRRLKLWKMTPLRQSIWSDSSKEKIIPLQGEIYFTAVNLFNRSELNHLQIPQLDELPQSRVCKMLIRRKLKSPGIPVNFLPNRWIFLSTLK